MGCGSSKKVKVVSVPPPNAKPTKSILKKPPDSTPPKSTPPVYTPPADFPTPKLLTDCQVHFAELDTDQLQRDDDEGYPLPFPPKTKKKEVFDREKYAYLRKKIQKAPKHLAIHPINELSQHIRGLVDTDAGRLYAAFCWVVYASQSLFEFGLESSPGRDTMLYRLILAHAGYLNYNDIFSDICSEMGYTVKKVKGQNKIFTPNQMVVSEEAYWLAVLLDNQWRPIDLEFAISVLAGRAKEGEDELPGVTEAGSEDEVVDDVTFLDAEFYFLTDPDEFIFSHFSEEEDWQMLARPVTYEEFKLMAHLTEAFFTMRFKDVQEAKGVLTSKEGLVDLKFYLSEDHLIKFEHTLCRLAGKEILTVIKGEKLNDLVTMTNDDGKKKFDMTLIDIGRYSLQIWAKDIKNEKSHSRLIGQWFIDCRKPRLYWESNPSIDGCEYGTSAEMKVLGLNLQNQQTVDGMAHVIFQSEEKEFDFLHTLEAKHAKRSQLRPYVVHYVTSNGSGVIMKFPSHGKYVLKTYVREKGTRKQLKLVCNLLFNSRVGYADLTPFPVSTSSRIGYMVDNKSMDFRAVSHTVPYFEETSGQPIVMTFESKVMYELMCYAEVQTLSGKEDVTSYTWYTIYEDPGSIQTEVELRIPYAGMYNLSIFARVWGENRMIFREVYKYVIVVDKPQAASVAFPFICDAWDPRFDLHTPRIGYFCEQEDVDFSIDIKNASDVSLYHGSTSLYQPLEPADEGTEFHGKIKTLNGNNEIYLSAALGQGKRIENLLQFVIVTEKDWLQIIQGHENSQAEANKRLQQINDRREEEELAAAAREKAAKEAAEQLEEQFEQEKEELFQKEEKLREEFQALFDEQNEKKGNKDRSKLGEGEEMKIIRNEIQSITEAHNSEIQRRKRLYKAMTENLVRQRLKQAIKQRDHTQLQKAVDDYYASKLPVKGNRDLDTAERLLDIHSVRKELIEATQHQDINAILDILDDIMVRGYQGSLQPEIAEAERLLNSMQKEDGLKNYILGMEKRLMSELHSYQKPPPAVHEVMKAVLLMLGEDEGTTTTWSSCAMRCNPYGVLGMYRRLKLLQLASIHPEIVARARQILDALDVNQVQRVSQGASMFYVWAKGSIEEYEGADGSSSSNSLDGVPAADIPRQKELLGKIPLQPY